MMRLSKKIDRLHKILESRGYRVRREAYAGDKVRLVITGSGRMGIGRILDNLQLAELYRVSPTITEMTFVSKSQHTGMISRHTQHLKELRQRNRSSL